VKEFRIEPEVYDDLAEAADWYDAKQPGLGDRFLGEMHRLISAIRDRPESFPLEAGQVRWAWTKPFPFKVYYWLEQENVRVFAVLHCARDPRAWRRRATRDEE
jgi:toxin ParE1/3/4